MDTLLRILLRILTPIQKIMQKIAPPEPRMNKEQVDDILFLAKPGLVLHSREALHFTANFIKGFWKHSAIVARSPENGEFYVVEAVGDDIRLDHKTSKEVNFGGVRKVPLEEWLYKKEHVLAQERVGYESEKLDDCAAWALDQCGKRYDYEFAKDDEDFYCSELVADALDIVIDRILEPTELSERKELKTVYDSRNGF